jgi:glycosyltransferase involved in cell wall biosynthesis
MELMACGKPAVVANTSGHRDIVSEHNALLLNNLKNIQIVDARKLTSRWQDPSLDELITAIEFAYHHREAIKKIGVKTGEDLKAFTWENTALKLLRVLEG